MQTQCSETQLQRTLPGMPTKGGLDHTLSRKDTEGKVLLSTACHEWAHSFKTTLPALLPPH